MFYPPSTIASSRGSQTTTDSRVPRKASTVAVPFTPSSVAFSTPQSTLSATPEHNLSPDLMQNVTPFHSTEPQPTVAVPPLLNDMSKGSLHMTSSGRCKKGYRKHRKTKKCEKPKKKKARTTKRCPRGSRRNKQGQCIHKTTGEVV
jgi:hypothetical protein